MLRLASFADQKLASGQAYFTREEARDQLGISVEAAAAAAARLVKKGQLASPRNGFYLIVRPEDRLTGAAEPAQWIGPLMRFQGLDYRVSLLRAAARHGSSHQAAMVFQVVAPRQLRDLELGRHRLQFLFQALRVFEQVNQPEFLDSIQTPAGYAKVAGVELTLLDCVRYVHAAGGLNSVAQVAKDLGAKADPRRLAKIAAEYEGSSVRRLGFLLELAGHERQARALEPAAKEAKGYVLLDPAIRPLVESLAKEPQKAPRWKLLVNDAVEVDA